MRTMICSLLLVATPAIADTPKGKVATLTVTSTAFTNGGEIPREFTCQGANVSPALSWSAVPPKTKSIAVTVEDPDAPNGGFLHWMVTNLPPTARSLDNGATLPDGAVASKNGKGQAGYTGPCPPTGTHHYHFHVYALDKEVAHNPTSRAEFAQNVMGHMLATGELVGVYKMK